MVVVGHRGARKECPENTVNSFVHAQRHGCLRFELDIQLSKDNEIVVIHDTTLKRTTGIRGRVNDYTLSELQEMDARQNTPGWRSPCPVPSLEEVVNHVPHTNHWQFEIKSDSKFRLNLLAHKLTHFIEEKDMADIVVVTSSNKWVLQRIKQLNPEQKTGYVAEYALPEPVKTANNLNCEFLICYYRLANEKTVSDADKLGMQVSCWTVNKISEMDRLKSLGVHSIITDIPTTAVARYG